MCRVRVRACVACACVRACLRRPLRASAAAVALGLPRGAHPSRPPHSRCSVRLLLFFSRFLSLAGSPRPGRVVRVSRKRRCGARFSDRALLVEFFFQLQQMQADVLFSTDAQRDARKQSQLALAHSHSDTNSGSGGHGSASSRARRPTGEGRCRRYFFRSRLG